MDAEELRRRFVDSAFLIDPVYLFESNPDPRVTAASLFAKCEALAKDREGFHSWLARVLEDSSTYCFFGSSLVRHEPGDVDMLQFTHVPGMLYIRKPAFISVLELQKAEGDLGNDWGCFFFGGLLFPHEPHEFILNTIHYCRQSAFASPFFNGGYGEPLTYAAFKAIGDESLFEPEEWEAVSSLRRFPIKYQRLDTANMRTVGYSAKEVNSQIRKELRSLDEKEMRALAMAATRRLGIKESCRGEVAKRFVSELRKLR